LVIDEMTKKEITIIKDAFNNLTFEEREIILETFNTILSIQLKIGFIINPITFKKLEEIFHNR